MATASSKVLSEALKISVQERVRIAEQLLESADAEGYEDESEAAIPIIYERFPTVTHVLAVAVDQRRPGYWAKRT